MDKIIYKNQLEYLKDLRKEPLPIIKDMELYARQNNIPILDWQSASLLEIIIRSIKAERVLEIGTAIAYSSIRIAMNIKKGGIVHTIEKSTDNIAIANKNIEKTSLQKRIKILEGNAFDIMPGLKKKYDLIFLDADKKDYKELLEMSITILKKNGVLFVDNMLWHGYTAAEKVPDNFKASTEMIREFNKIFTNHPKLNTTVLTIGDGIGLGIKSKKK